MTVHTDRILVPVGTLLFAEGDDGTAAYVIKRGRVEIFLPRGDGDIVLVDRGPGEIVGEMAIIDRGRRSASARVVEECDLAVITADQFDRRIAKTDPILRMCLGVVMDRYRQTMAMLGRPKASRRQAMPRSAPDQHIEEALQTLSFENEIRRAIAFEELELYFQPIVRLPDRQLAGFEALIRWNHPERGLVAPGLFIPVAEASGLIVEITTWCIREVGRLFPSILAVGRDSGFADGDLFMSLNISGHDLTKAAFLGELVAMLDRTGLPAECIKLEVTESVLMNEPLKAAAVLNSCRARGMMVAIDDFGTGYSSLSHLSTLPITTIKIDQSFVRSMVADPTSRKIIQMILRLAGELDIPVVAEGIEGDVEARHLGLLGCALGQGYLFGRPQPIGTTLDVVQRWNRVSRRPKVALRHSIDSGGTMPVTTAA